MQSKKLYLKYAPGRHWETHSTQYAEKFATFLKSVNFRGLLVDVGCGAGRDVGFFSKLGINTLGIDNSPQEINNCKKKFPELKFEIQDVENLKFKKNSVDAFFMINVIHYVDKEKALQEIFKTLKSSGYLFIHFNIHIIDKYKNIDYHQDQKEIIQLISRFKIIRQKLFERVDFHPVEHTHTILELILQK